MRPDSVSSTSAARFTCAGHLAALRALQAIWPSRCAEYGETMVAPGGARRRRWRREPGVDEGEQLLHGRPHVGIVDALLCPEHDRSRPPAGPELGKCCSSTARPSALSELGTSDVALNAGPIAPAPRTRRRAPPATGRWRGVDDRSTSHWRGDVVAFLLSGRAGGLVVVGDVGDSGDALCRHRHHRTRWSHRTSGHSATARSVDARLVLSADPLVAPLAYDFVVVRDLARSLWAEPRHPTTAAAVVGPAPRLRIRSAILLEGILREDLAWRPASIAMVLVLAPALLWRRTPTTVAAVAFGTCIAIEVASLAAGEAGGRTPTGSSSS